MKKMKLMSVLMLSALLVVGCGAKTTENDKPESNISTEVVEEVQGQYLVTAEYAKERVGADDVIFVDCRGEKDAKKGTVEGAIALTWKELSRCGESFGEAGDEEWGKIPEAADYAKRLSSYGLEKDKEIITIGYTTDGWGDDGRIVWQLVAAGYENVKMVDGGFEALKEADVPMQKGASEPKAATVKVDEIDMTHVMETEELERNYDEYVVLDVRTEKEYDGATKYGEAKGGHLPNAIFFPYTEIFEKDATLKSKTEIVQMLEELGVEKDDKIVTYCTAGIRSAYVQLVLEMCGYENTWNYDQSFWRWCVVNEVE